MLKRLAKVLISLRVCADWSEALLVAHTILLEISCTGSIILIETHHNNKCNERGGTGGWGSDPLHLTWKITKLPSQQSMVGHHRPASETPLKWRFAGGSMVARFVREKTHTKMCPLCRSFLDPWNYKGRHVFVVREQQMRWPACASVQSDQRFCKSGLFFIYSERNLFIM